MAETRQKTFWLSWRALALGAAACAAGAPIVATFLGGLGSGGIGQSAAWSGAGASYVAGTIGLCLLVGAGAGLIGSVCALLISLCDFPGRRVLALGLALPFAIPAYVAAYAYGDLMGPFGPAAELFGRAYLPEIRSLPGAAFILTLTTYPYVYFAICASLAERSGALMETARALGASPMRAARRIFLGAARPALAGGLALALMETAADFGVADFYGVPTLSVGIFRTWYGLGDLAAATQLAAGLFLVALILVLLEEAGRRGRSAEPARTQRRRTRLKLSAPHAGAAITFCAIPVTLGFIAPTGLLASKLDLSLSAGAARGLGQALLNTAGLGAIGAAIAIASALTLAYAARRAPARGVKLALRIATMGYAIPGAVIAIGMLALIAGFSSLTGAAVSGGVGVLLYAYVVRFLTAGYNSTAAGLQQVSIQMDEAAKALGAGPRRIVTQIHFPQTQAAIFSGAAIIAIDIAKELPATLLLRPFNFETLATHIYRLASDERLADAAPAALMLIILGLAPVIMLSVLSSGKVMRAARKSRQSLAGGALADPT